MAIRILGQMAFSRCERIGSLKCHWTYSHNEEKDERDRLEHQRHNDLVYATYNLRR